MQLRTARLCLDCEEVHDAEQCPHCASESFTFLSRWVPVDERRARPRPPATEQADVYRRLATGEAEPSRAGRLLKQGVFGLAALGVVGWLWGTRDVGTNSRTPQDGPKEPQQRGS